MFGFQSFSGAPISSLPGAIPPPAPGETVTVDKWTHPTAQPFRTKAQRAAVALLVAAIVPIVPHHDGGYAQAALAPLGDPSRKRAPKKLAFEHAHISPLIEGDTHLAKWHQPLDIPSRNRRAKRTAFELFDQEPLNEGPTTFAKWSQPFDTPARKRRPKATAFQVLDVIEDFVVVEIVTLDKWDHATAQPYRVRLPRKLAFDLFSVSPLVEGPTDFSKWGSPLEIPSRTRRAKKTAHEFFDAEPITEGPTTFGKWGDPLGIPSRTRRANQIAFELFDIEPTTEGPTTFGKWGDPLGIPSRRKDNRKAQKALEQLRFTPIVEVVLFDKWNAATIVPRRFRLPRKTYLGEVLGNAPGSDNAVWDTWGKGLDGPRRYRAYSRDRTLYILEPFDGSSEIIPPETPSEGHILAHVFELALIRAGAVRLPDVVIGENLTPTVTIEAKAALNVQWTVRTQLIKLADIRAKVEGITKT